MRLLKRHASTVENWQIQGTDFVPLTSWFRQEQHSPQAVPQLVSAPLKNQPATGGFNAESFFEPATPERAPSWTAVTDIVDGGRPS